MKKRPSKQATFFDAFEQDVFAKRPTGQKTPETRKTSAEAAAVRPESARVSTRKRVLECIKAAGAAGVTDEQIAARTGINPNTCRPRRIELLDARKIQPAGRRETASGSSAVVWIFSMDDDG